MISFILIALYYSMFIYRHFLTSDMIAIADFIIFISLFTFSIIYNFKILRRHLKRLLNDIKINIKSIIIYSIITAIIYFVATFIIGYFMQSFAITKEAVQDSDLTRVFINLLIWAPITEELLFRSLLNKDIKNKQLLIVLSSILFAGVHVIGNGFNLITLINFIPYFIIGMYLGFLYRKTNNIVINIIMHLLINIIGVVMILTMVY